MTLISWSQFCWWSSAFTGFNFMSQPQGDAATSFCCLFLFFWSQPQLFVATSLSLSHLYSRSRPQGDVATSFAVCLALLQVATSVSGRDIVCGLIIKWSQLQFSCQDFSSCFHVATYTAFRGLNWNLSLKTSCNVFYL